MATSATGRSADAAAIDPASLLLYSLTLDGLTLSEGVGAYGAPEDPLLPIGEMASLLEADIDVLPVERRIVGRIGEARRSLLVDLRLGVARAGSQEVRLASEDAAVTATEIYLRASALQKLLPLTLDIAPDELAIRITAREAFPVQARLQRLANRAGGPFVAGAEEEALTVMQPYAFFAPPGIDVVLDTGMQSAVGGATARYDLRLAGDVLWSNFQGFLASDEEGRPTSARALLQRRSLEGDLLGPLRAREINAGDTFTPGLALGPRSVAGRGVSFSTVPLDQTNIFNRIDLRGELPPGFDAELYVNDVLKGSTNQAVNGRYEFLDVPLAAGVNVLRIVTYGSRGERNEEIQVINIGAGLLRPGEATLSFGAVEQDEPLFRLRRGVRPSLGQPGLFEVGGLRLVAGLNYGISSRWTGTLGVALAPRPDGRDVGVLTVGARTSLFGLATQFDVAWDDEKGRAASVGLAGQYRGVSAILRHAQYEGGFLDENNLGASRLAQDHRTELTMDASLNLRGRIVPVSIRAIHDRYEDGSSDVLAAARASSSMGAVLLSTGFEYERRHFRPSRALETLSGYLAASTYRSYRWQIRATLDYDILPDPKARLLTLSIDRRLSDRWGLRFALGQPLDRTDQWNMVLSSIYATSYGDLALTGEYDNSDEDWRVSAQWSFGLGYYPGRGYQLTRTGPGSGGSMLFDAFIDENGDGIRQAHEKPAPNVEIGNGGSRQAATGPDGRAYVTGLGAGPTSRMDVSLEHVENPSVRTPPQRLDLRPRPGGLARVAFPMQPTGEVMVHVELLRDDGNRVGLSAVKVQLVPQTGAPVDAVTEFDGSAIFQTLPVATYRLQLEPRQAEKLRMRMLESPSVVIRGDGDFTPDIVVQVRFDPPTTDVVATEAGKP